MAEKDPYNDEYQFAELDANGMEPLDMEDSVSHEEASTPGKESKKDIKRNALIVIALIIVLMLGYKLLAWIFSSKARSMEKVPTTPAIVTPKVETPAPVQAATPTPAPAPVVMQPSQDIIQINQKLSSLEMGQQSVRSESSSLSNQLNGVNSNVKELSEKIAGLNQAITELMSKVERQAHEIELLAEKNKPKPVIRHKKIRIRGPIAPSYYIQAVIPGRAWLIRANGSTLTVREGTIIPGYGIVKLIDPNQGRVVTSSGRVIRFSQQDS